MIIKERMYRGVTIFGKDFGWFYDVHYFVPLTEPSKVTSVEKQIETTNTIRAGVAENEKKFDREQRLSA